MKTTLDHLSPRRQAELAQIREIILEELQSKIKAAGSARSRRYKLLKLILFGSFAKGTWFDDKHSGRTSDFDLLVIVSHRELTDMSAFWEEVEDRFFHDPLVKRDVSLIVHTLPDVNRQLKEGQYFFSEIVNQGILLYEEPDMGSDGKPKNILAKPGTPNSLRAYELGAGYHQSWYRLSKLFLDAGRQHISAKETEARNFAAFQLHQAAEGAYRMFLLTVTLYAPGTHHLGKLRKLAQTIDERLEEVWVPSRKPYRRYFEMLRRAYVEARYSEAYETTKGILVWQADRARHLIEIADALCSERLEQLRREARST